MEFDPIEYHSEKDKKIKNKISKLKEEYNQKSTIKKIKKAGKKNNVLIVCDFLHYENKIKIKENGKYYYRHYDSNLLPFNPSSSQIRLDIPNDFKFYVNKIHGLYEHICYQTMNIKNCCTTLKFIYKKSPVLEHNKGIFVSHFELSIIWEKGLSRKDNVFDFLNIKTGVVNPVPTTFFIDGKIKDKYLFQGNHLKYIVLNLPKGKSTNNRNFTLISKPNFLKKYLVAGNSEDESNWV